MIKMFLMWMGNCRMDYAHQPSTFDGMVEGRHGQAQLGRLGPSGKLHQGLLAPVEQSPAGGWCVTTTVGDTRR